MIMDIPQQRISERIGKRIEDVAVPQKMVTEIRERSWTLHSIEFSSTSVTRACTFLSSAVPSESETRARCAFRTS